MAGYFFWLLLVGDRTVGKSSIARRFYDENFDSSYTPTWGKHAFTRGVRHQLEFCTVLLESGIFRFEKTGNLRISTQTISKPLFG